MQKISLFSSLLKKLSSNGGKQILLVVHKGADVDAIASAGTLYFLLSKKNSVKIAVPEHMNLNARALAENLKIPYSIGEDLKQNFFDIIFILDCSSADMLSCYDSLISLKHCYVIDHHISKLKGKNFLILPKEISTCSIIYSIMKKAKIKPNRKEAACLCAGIIADSVSLTLADSKTFLLISELLSFSGKDYQGIEALYESKIDISEKISNLKAAKRCRLFRSLDFIIALTEVDAFEASAASVLVKLGASVCFAAGVKKGQLLLSARASPLFIKQTGFSLVKDVFPALEKQFIGSGGGHAGAASFNCSAADSYAVLEVCLKQTHIFIERHYGKSLPLKEY